jgi:hypothetical protein
LQTVDRNRSGPTQSPFISFKMLDENLPTFRAQQASDNPLSHVLYFTQNGADPVPEYVVRRPDPTQNGAGNRYAVALCDPYNPEVIYGEVLIIPEWTRPTLSAAELRAQSQRGGPPVPQTPIVPDSFNVLLYNPDQSVAVKMVPGGWNKNDSWEFEMPTQTFKMPSLSELDRQQGPATAGDLLPRIMFRWKKDGKLGKDMTCFMTGKSLGGRKSKDPDITVALFKAARECTVQIYEPNLQRVEVEDRKGLEVVMLLVAEVVKDLWLMPKPDIFNVSGAPLATVNGRARKNSRPSPTVAARPPLSNGAAMSGAIGGSPPRTTPMTSLANATPAAASSPAIDAETQRLKAMVEQEEREREAKARRERAEREKLDKAEEKRIKRMLEEEEKERRRHEAEVAKETERLRKMYGTQGQDLPSSAAARPPHGSSPPLPARLQGGYPIPQPNGFYAPQQLVPNMPALPPRPVSVGPMPGPMPPQPMGNSWWQRPAATPTPKPTHHQPGWRRNGSGSGFTLQNPAASASTFFGRNTTEGERQKMQKKRSMQW